MEHNRVRLIEVVEDDVDGYLALLGTLPDESGRSLQTIVRVQRMSDLPASETFLHDFVARAELLNENDIVSLCLSSLDEADSVEQYSWLKAWFVEDRPHLPDMKIDVICPATDSHIRKVT